MLPKLECVKFSGVKPTKFVFKNFQAQFQNCEIHLESNEVKLSLLFGLEYILIYFLYVLFVSFWAFLSFRVLIFVGFLLLSKEGFLKLSHFFF